MLTTPMQPPRSARVLGRLPQLAVALSIAAALGAAIIGPAAVGGSAVPPPSALIAERTLRFADRADGAVVVLDGDAEVAVFEGEQGFIRGILRSMGRQRRELGVAFAKPFHLAAWADGRMTLEDLGTGQRLDLEAYGPGNAAVFATLLPGVVPNLPPEYRK